MNTLKLTPTLDGQIKVRVVSPSERDQSAIVSFDELQELIRQTQVGEEASVDLEPEEGDPGAVEAPQDPPAPTDTGQTPDAGPSVPDPAPPDPAAAEVDLSQPVEGEPQVGDNPLGPVMVDQEPSAPAEDNVAEVDDGPTERQGPGM